MPKIATIIVLLLAGCGRGVPPEPAVPGRWYSASQVNAGRPLYATHCAVCHGGDGSATPDWRTPGPDGHYPPPPLNGKAHTWHHPLDVLESTIAEGGSRLGGEMPAFVRTLDKDQRLAVVAHIQTWWTQDIYDRWEEIDGRSR